MFKKRCLLLLSFWVKDAKVDFFQKKWGLSVFFYKIEAYFVTIWSTRLEKHQANEIELRVEFLRIL